MAFESLDASRDYLHQCLHSAVELTTAMNHLNTVCMHFWDIPAWFVGWEKDNYGKMELYSCGLGVATAQHQKSRQLLRSVIGETRPPLFFRHPSLSLRISEPSSLSPSSTLQNNVRPFLLATATPKCPAASPRRWPVPRSVHDSPSRFRTLALVQDPTQEGRR